MKFYGQSEDYFCVPVEFYQQSTITFITSPLYYDTKMQKTILMGLTIVIGVTMVLSLGTSNLALATVENNLFGQEARELAQCESDCLDEEDTNKGAMGQHSSDERSGGERSSPRVGIGNVGEEILDSDEKLTPSEVIGELCGEDGDDCP
jgi:hypothetical protein